MWVEHLHDRKKGVGALGHSSHLSFYTSIRLLVFNEVKNPLREQPVSVCYSQLDPPPPPC